MLHRIYKFYTECYTESKNSIQNVTETSICVKLMTEAGGRNVPKIDYVICERPLIYTFQHKTKLHEYFLKHKILKSLKSSIMLLFSLH